jgi:putative oxidoreductase
MFTPGFADRLPACITVMYPGVRMLIIHKIPLALGRICLSLIFIISGVKHAMSFSEGCMQLQGKGFPLPPMFMAAAVFCLIVGGLEVATGYFSRIGALLLIVFLLIVTPTFHDFWSYHGTEGQMQAINFMKNLGLLGGLLVVYACAGDRRPHPGHALV